MTANKKTPRVLTYTRRAALPGAYRHSNGEFLHLYYMQNAKKVNRSKRKGFRPPCGVPSAQPNCIQAGSETETSYTFIMCEKRNLSSPPCGRIFYWRNMDSLTVLGRGVANFALRNKPRGALPASVGSTENIRSNPIERHCRRGPRKVPQRSRAERGHFVGQKPQALMQAPRGDFPRGAANIALRGKGAERTPRALVARRTVKGQGSRCVGVRDGSGDRAAGADASTPRGFPTGCCEYRLAARWWRCGESNPGPDDH